MPNDPIHILPNKFKSNIDVLLLLIPAMVFAIILTILIAKLPHTLAGSADQEVLGNEAVWVK